MVLTIIARTENVKDEVLPRLDAALARHAPKWMKLSGPKLRDRIDLWVAKFDPAGVRIPPKVNDNRYVDIGETSPGDGRDLGQRPCHRRRGIRQALDALAATVCHADPRTKEQRRADATGRWRAVRRGWPASADQPTARPQPRGRRPVPR